MITKNDH